MLMQNLGLREATKDSVSKPGPEPRDSWLSGGSADQRPPAKWRGGSGQAPQSDRQALGSGAGSIDSGAEEKEETTKPV